MEILLIILTFWIPIKKYRQRLRNKLEFLIPLKKNWILFYDTFSKNGNGDSIYPIVLEISKKYPNFKMFFVSKEKTFIELADEVLILNSKKFYKVLKRVKFLISPMDFPTYKKKGQIFFMTWHGTPLKKLYLSKNDSEEYRNYLKQFEMADYFCISCDDYIDIYKNSMLIKPEIMIKTGLPRNDVLFSKDISEISKKVKEKIGVPKNKKIIFYCPTWRQADNKMPLAIDLEKLEKEIGNEYCILLRSHVGKHNWINKDGNIVNLTNNSFVFNVNDYPNISELYIISDIFISDYSSSMFDFSITQKPQIFYAYDLEEYQRDFGFYFDYETFVPGAIAKNNEELIELIKHLDNLEVLYKNKMIDFKKKYCSYENGTATRQIINLLLKG